MTFKIKNALGDSVKTALKAGNKREVGALRLALAAIKQQEVDTRTDVDDETAIGILTKLCKQRRESIEQFDKAGRTDLVEQEQFELELLQTYLPDALGDEEILAAIVAAIASTGATSPKDMGLVMADLKSSLHGRADMKAVSGIVKSRLAG
ncbi:MAG: GatB/YqeY domain-containing protein [Proteobacteria bacterium]|nr:GatB/YqeY domain-containing protein [Pseudomonadota bacterium]